MEYILRGFKGFRGISRIFLLVSTIALDLHGNLAVPGASPSLIWGQQSWPRARQSRALASGYWFQVLFYKLVKGAIGIYSSTPPCKMGFIVLNGFYSKQYKETYFFPLFR